MLSARIYGAITLGLGAFASIAAGQSALRYPAIPIEYSHLANGLKVVLARDTTTPVVVVAVYYGVGQRTEGHGQEGFAHLFEHLMFEGSTHLGPGELIKLISSNGGTLNGNTRYDFTDYFEIVPPAALQLMLWAEADRMGGLVVDDSALHRQKEIVKSEVRLSYVNRADGGFPWLDVPQAANRNWQNAHNFRGLPAQLDSATLEEVRRFHDMYYVPNNAALVISGNFRVADGREWVAAYFNRIPRGADITRPDASEAAQIAERHGERIDSLARSPVLAVAYHMPPRNTPAYYAMAVIDQLVLQGDDSWIRRAVVRGSGLADAVYGGANLQGNMLNYQGPMLWTVAANFEQTGRAPVIVDSIQAVLDRLAADPVSDAALRLAQQKARSAYYDILDDLSGFGRADLLASFALFDDHPDEINGLESAINNVTATSVMATARDYLSTSNRTVYVRRPYSAPAIELLGHIIRAPRFDTVTTSMAVQTVAERGPRAPTEVSTAAEDVFRTTLFPGGEFGRPCAAGGRSAVYTPSAVRHFYAARATGAGTTVYVVGQFNRATAAGAVARAFGGLPRGEAGAVRGVTGPAPAPALLVVQQPGAKQIALMVGERVPGPSDSDYTRLRVANALLGGSLISRITVNIREAHGYAYAPGSDLVATPSGEAYWAEATNVAAPVAWPALREIIKEVARLGVDAPPDSELGAQRYVIGRTLVTRATRAGALDALEATDAGAGGSGGDARRLLGVTPGEVRRVVGAYIAPRDLTIVLAGDTTAMGAQIADLRRGVAALRAGQPEGAR